MDRSLRQQINELKAYGCSEIFFDEFVSQSTDKQEQLKLALKSLNRGDELVITKLDRIAKSLQNLNLTLKKLQKNHVDLIVLKQKFGAPINDGESVSDIVNAIAQFDSTLKRKPKKASNEIYQSDHDPELQSEAEIYVNQEYANTGVYPSKNDVAKYLLEEFILHNKYVFGKDLDSESVLRRFTKTW